MFQFVIWWSLFVVCPAFVKSNLLSLMSYIVAFHILLSKFYCLLIVTSYCKFMISVILTP